MHVSNVMAIKVGDTYDLVGYKGKKTPVQVASAANGIYTIVYLDNSGKPAGTCREEELVKRAKSGKAEEPKKKAETETVAETVEATTTDNTEN